MNGRGARQLILPCSLKSNVRKAIFDDLGHQAVEKSIELARSRFYWPGMMADVADYCRTCGPCTLAKAGKKLHPTTIYSDRECHFLEHEDSGTL